MVAITRTHRHKSSGTPDLIFWCDVERTANLNQCSLTASETKLALPRGILKRSLQVWIHFKVRPCVLKCKVPHENIKTTLSLKMNSVFFSFAILDGSVSQIRANTLT